MLTVQTYVLNGPGAQTDVDMPHKGKVLHAALQDGVMTIWAQVDPDAFKVGRRFLVLGTGGEIPRYAEYIDTIHEGALAWHVYENV